MPVCEHYCRGRTSVKVAFFSNFHQPCGIADYSQQLVQELSRLADVKVVHSPLPPQQPYKYSSLPYYLKHFRRCARELNDGDICHIQHEYSFWGGVRPFRNLFPCFASAITVPVVMTAHEILDPPYRAANFKGALQWLSSGLSPCSSRYSNYVNAGVFQWSDRTIVHTGQQRDLLMERGVSPDRITLIPHGIAPCAVSSLEAAQTVRNLKLEGRRLLTIIGFISQRKGYELVLQVLPHLPDDVTLVIAGGCRTNSDEEYLKVLRGLLERSGLTRRVVITGYLDADVLCSVVRASSAVLAPFNAVAGSGTISIALASGVPVVASKLPPLVELNQSARAMLLFTTGDASDLLLKIRQLLTGKQLFDELSASALRYACQNSMRSVADRTYALYENVLANRAKLRTGRS